MKEFLSRAGVPFTVRNVDEDHEAFNELVTHGVMSIPFTLVGDQAIRGYDEQKLRDALAARAGQPPGR